MPAREKMPTQVDAFTALGGSRALYLPPVCRRYFRQQYSSEQCDLLATGCGGRSESGQVPEQDGRSIFVWRIGDLAGHDLVAR